MAKQGMKRPEPERRKNEVPPVPEISGKGKHGHNHAAPIIPGENGVDDLARENLMNDLDMTAADMQDLWRDR